MRALLIGSMLFAFSSTLAQTVSVSPSQVNAYSQGVTSVLLTFGGMANKRPAEATWCGDVIPAAPDLGLKCNPANVFGRLPARYDQLTRSGNAAFTDVMSITPQVARRAYLDAVGGATSTFFYVRRFVSTVGAPDEYVPVTIRLSGNGAGVPLSLTEVKLTWGVDKPVLFVNTGEKLPKIRAEITYTGTGRLKGRWEIVKPGELPPEPRDLLTEATLPFEERGTQKRYSEISRFNVYLSPTGKIILPGPEIWRVDESLVGLYLILLRIEASDDKEADTNLESVGAGGGVVHSGAVAGFSLPVLRYYVANGATARPATGTVNGVSLTGPEDQVVLAIDKPVDFTWSHVENAATSRLEVQDLQGKPIISAILSGAAENYRAPSWFRDRAGELVMRWRVTEFDESGRQVGESSWRTLRLGKSSAAETAKP